MQNDIEPMPAVGATNGTDEAFADTRADDAGAIASAIPATAEAPPATKDEDRDGIEPLPAEGVANATDDVFAGTRKDDAAETAPPTLATAAAPPPSKGEDRARRLALRQLAAAGSDWMLDTFRACAEDARRWAEADKGAKSQTSAFLGRIYDATQHPYWTVTRLKAHCKNRGIPCTNATIASPYKAFITASRNSGGYAIDTKEASRLGRALQWAARQQVQVGSIPEFLHENGGVSGCIRKLVEAKKAEKATLANSTTLSPSGSSASLDLPAAAGTGDAP